MFISNILNGWNGWIKSFAMDWYNVFQICIAESPCIPRIVGTDTLFIAIPRYHHLSYSLLSAFLRQTLYRTSPTIRKEFVELGTKKILIDTVVLYTIHDDCFEEVGEALWHNLRLAHNIPDHLTIVHKDALERLWAEGLLGITGNCRKSIHDYLWKPLLFFWGTVSSD